jgi:anthranilate synthase component II
MKILVLDNYDSFTYNLVHIIKELGYQVDVIRNDKISVEEVAKYDKILLSPGPGIPEEAGIMHEVIRTYGATKSILGVCLGHQGIGEVYGSKLTNMPTVLHGFGLKTTIVDKECRLFKGLPETFVTGRYHSWVEDGRIMGLRHKKYDVIGVQFHPESILTENGIQMMKNWLEG